MKSSRIFPLLLLTIVLTSPLMANAQQHHVDTLRYSIDCGQSPGYDFAFINWDTAFITQIQLVVLTDSVTFADDETSEVAHDIDEWNDSVNYNYGFDTATYDANQGFGVGFGADDTGHYFLLGGPGGSPFTRFDQPVTIEWISEITVNGHIVRVVNTGYIVLLPTSFQGICTYDTVTATGATVGCDPQFDFHVFNRNGEDASINAVNFEVEGASAGSMRPSEIQAPPGWQVNSVTRSSVYFTSTSDDPNGISPQGNLNGFIVSLLANPAVNNFTFVWTAYNSANGITALIDRDTVRNISAKPQPCSSNPSPDSVIITNNSGCAFTIDTKNYHSGSGTDSVSPIAKYALTITTPGVIWDTAFLPPQAHGSWEYGGLGTSTLMFFMQPKYDSNLVFAQPGGTIWTMQASIDDTRPVPGQDVTVQWSDSLLSTGISSGTDVINCKIGNSDIALIQSAAECSYTLIVENQHTDPSSPIHAVQLQIPPSSGTFSNIASCYSASNGWIPSGIGTSTLIFTSPSSKNDLAFGNNDTLHFCIDPASPNTPWQLTWTTLGIGDTTITSGDSTLSGCNPPLICDSVQHSRVSNMCEDTITVLNQREGGAELDTVVVTPASGTTIDSATPITDKWSKTIIAGGASVLFTGPAISSGSLGRFFVSYAGDTAKFAVTVTTYSAGVTCAKTDTLSCASSGVSPMSTPQSLDVTVVPNPMNDEANISLSLGTFGHVQMVLLDVLGRAEKTVVDGTLGAGDHAYTLDVSQLPPGTYYLRIEASGATVTKKLVIEH